jgi:hypothetical protein
MGSVRHPGVRALVLLVGLSLGVTACSSMGNTLAQEIAWDAWNSCPKTANIVLDRIDTDGRIYWIGRNGTHGFADLQTCIQKYYAEGGARRQRAVVPPPPIGVVPPAVAGPLLAPLWKRGDEWAYGWQGAEGKGTYVQSVDREEAVGGVPHYVVKTGTRETFYRKTDFAITRESIDGKVVLQYTPARLRYVWPLEVGKSWEQTVHMERPVERQSVERAEVATIEAEETISVPAGTFKTLRIVYRNKGTGAIQYEEWYSSELKGPARLREGLASGSRMRELLNAKLR